MKSYVIGRERKSWVLRRSGSLDQMFTDEELVAVREHAFERLRGWAPCTLRIRGEVREEWELGHRDGQWVQVEIGNTPYTCS